MLSGEIALKNNHYYSLPFHSLRVECLFVFILLKGYVLSGEIALKNTHYYYYY